MRRFAAAVLFSAIAVSTFADLPSTQPSAVPVKSVVLFSSGVGYFEHFGTVNGSGTTELRFKTQQVNDILKSLVLQDVDGGKVTALNYPSLDPVGKTLKSFQVDITSNPGLGDLLNGLRGAKVKLTAAGESREGTILGLEHKKAVGPEKEAADVWMMNLVTHGRIRSVNLDQVTDLDLEEPRLQEELDKALAALAQARDQEKKPITIHFDGQGNRHVRIGYVVETPIWKTSYRLILGKKHQLQGWALVENQTDNDWNDVQLALVSGRPISFIQDLYQPLYIPRPLVKPDQLVSVKPQTYEGGIDAQKNAEKLRQGQAQMQQLQQAAQMRRNNGGQGGSGGGNLFGNAGGAQAEDALDPTASVVSLASAAKVGELFQYTVGNVTLPRQESAMIPIITDPLEVERLSIYNQTVLADHPLYGARLHNTTGKHLLAGPITVIDNGSYAGDASIDNVPPGQSRLVSYGIDLELFADATHNDAESHLVAARFVKGMLETTMRTLDTQQYLFDNKGDHDRTVIVEHPFNANVELVETEKPIETTPQVYRFKGVVPAGKQWKLIVKQQETSTGGNKIVEMNDEGMASLLQANIDYPKPVREGLEGIVQRRAAIAESQRKLKEATDRIAEVATEQQRIRENMKTVTQPTSDYYNRLLKKLDDQETSIEKIQKEAEENRATAARQRRELDEYEKSLETK